MEISITRGLAELKLLGNRIEKAIRDSSFASHAIGKKSVKGYATVSEFEEKANAQLQSVESLIKRRQVIKSAIVISNAETNVTIAGEKMTVAEAIERKSSIAYEKMLLEKLARDFHSAVNQVEKENYQVQVRLDNLLVQNFGKDAKVKAEDMEAISKPYLEQNEAKVIDPVDAKKRIEELQKKIEDFESEVDFVLSESNTITKIEIPE